MNGTHAVPFHCDGSDLLHWAFASKINVKHSLMEATVLKSIIKVGNSQGLIFDTALCELTGLRAGDQVNITVHQSGTVVLTPMRETVNAETAAGAAKDLIRRNAKLFKRLA